MDFSQVKSVTIPEGEVTKIEVGGATIWEKGEDWGELTYLNDGVSNTYTLRSESDFNKLGNNDDATASLTFSDGTSIVKNTITAFEFGTSVPAAIPNYFLASCTALNSPIGIPSGVTSIGTLFLGYCSSFNQPVTFQGEFQSIGRNFMLACTSFNQPITAPVSNLGGYKSVAEGFLKACTAFNSALTIPSGVLVIEPSFLDSCASFNQPITLPSGLVRIGEFFLDECGSFSQALQIPSSVTSVGTYFMADCRSFTGLLTVDTSAHPSDTSSLASNGFKTDPMVQTGITLSGTYASTWKNALPDNYGPGAARPYRKLILG